MKGKKNQAYYQLSTQFMGDESAKLEPTYPELDKRARDITDKCIDDVLEKNRLGTE